MIPCYDKKINRKVRVFISSTFSDMQSERDIIVHSVFPRLRQEFSSRLIDIAEVDLRWGIPEDDTDSSQILEICIGEVLHCAPFFVGIVGDRYGSIASDRAIDSLPPAYKKALGETVPSGLSITELEMRAGVFVPNNVDFSCFFIKNQALKPTVQPEVNHLISSIQNTYCSYSYETGLEFEELLYVNLRNYINKVIPEQLENPYGDESYFSHLKILKNHNYRYQANHYFIARAERKINQYRQVYLQGEKGQGKSACISFLIRQEGIERDGCVFYHYSGAGDQSAHTENLFHRLHLFLQSEFGCTSTEQEAYAAVLDMIRSDAITRRTVLFIDGMDYLDDVTAIYRLFSLTSLNDNIFVVCSGTETYSRIMGDQIMVMEPLTADQIDQIAGGTLNQYGKRLNRRQKQKLLRQKNCTNPLFLRALLSQLIVYGVYDSFDEYLDSLLETENLSQLFSIAVLRIRKYFSENGIPADRADLALALIVYSNNGITETELQDLLEVLPMVKSIFVTALELFTIEDNGRIRFNHDLIVDAAKDILQKTGLNYENIAREKLAAYFANKEANWRRFSELPYQLCKLGMTDALLYEISQPDCFVYLYCYEYHACIGYLSHLVDSQEELARKLIAGLEKKDLYGLAELLCLSGCHNAAISVSEEILREETDIPARVRILDIIARSQYKLGLNGYSTAIQSYEQLIEYYQCQFPGDEVGYASRAYLLGVTYKSAGNVERSIEVLRECANIFRRNQIRSATSCWVMDVYGLSCFNAGKTREAMEILDQTISDCTDLFGKLSPELAWAYCYGWGTLYAAGDKVNAMEMIRRAYEIYYQIYLGRGTKIAWAAVNAGTAALINNDPDQAEKHYFFSIRENDCILPEDQRPHVYSLTIYANLACLYEQTNRHEQAIETVRFALDHSQKKNGANHIYTTNILLLKGIIEKDPALISQAAEAYQHQGMTTPDLFFSMICLARIYAGSGQSEKAAEVLNRCSSAYFSKDRETDLLTYLLLETIEKVTGELTDDMAEELDELYRYEDYKYILTYNNNSQILIIPRI